MEKEDFLTVYLQGRYDEKKRCESIIKDIITDIQSKINWNNHYESLYAIKKLNDVLKIEKGIIGEE